MQMQRALSSVAVFQRFKIQPVKLISFLFYIYFFKVYVKDGLPDPVLYWMYTSIV